MAAGHTIINHTAYLIYFEHPKPTLHSRLQQVPPLHYATTYIYQLSFLERMLVAQQVLSALKFLEGAYNPYANLRPYAIFVEGNVSQLHTYLFDYSVTKGGEKDCFTPPEILDGDDSFDIKAANVYSFGTLLWYLLRAEDPYVLYDNKKIYQFSNSKSLRGLRPPIEPIPGPYPSTPVQGIFVTQAKNILQRLLKYCLMLIKIDVGKKTQRKGRI